MRIAQAIVQDILILKLGDKNAAKTEANRLSDMVNSLDADISDGMLSTQERFIQCIQKQMSENEISKKTLAMLKAVYKTHSEPKSISMLGKLLFTENTIQDDYTLILLYRLLEQSGLTIKAVPNGYNMLRKGISDNKVLDFTKPVQAEASPEFTDSDLLKALFIMNDEPDEDIACVNECTALFEYKRIVNEAKSMNSVNLADIPDYTSYPCLVLAIGLRVLSLAGKTIEFKKDTFERFVLSILTRQPVNGFTVCYQAEVTN